MTLPTLYARTSTGAIQQWTLEIEGSGFRTIHGQVDGKLQTTEWTVCLPKNEGKKNATSAEQQAEKEGKATWKKKKETGYFEDINDVDIELFTEPMLAKDYDDRKDEIEFPVLSQPKLDGIRCIARKDALWTRRGKKHNSVPHIAEALKKIFDTDHKLILDGELYCDKYASDFNTLSSIVRKADPNEEEIQFSKQNMQYWIYDMADPTISTLGRTGLIKTIVEVIDNASIVLVPTHIANDQEELDALYEQYIEHGFEGQMVRAMNGKYEFKRSKNLLKRKEFQDKEYVILDVIEGIGNRVGTAGAMVFKNEEGRQFNSNIKGNRKYVRELWEQRETLIGKEATIKFFRLTPDNVPRFPFVIAIRDYE